MKKITEDDKKTIALAKKFVLAILMDGEPPALSFYEAYNIQSGDKEALLNHLKAINNIISNAINLLGENNE